jgi:hypothetical protein
MRKRMISARRMHDLLRRPRVRQAARQPIGDAEPALDLAKGQQPALRGQPATVKPRDDHLAMNR